MAFSPISTTNPTTVYAPSLNIAAGQPNARWNNAITVKKTSTFWVTSVAGTGDNPVYTLPYASKVYADKIGFGYQNTKTVNGTNNVTQQFTEAMQMGITQVVTAKQIARQDLFGCEWEFNAGINRFTTTFVSGQAFCVGHYFNTTPKITTINAFLSINGQGFGATPTNVTGNRFEIEINNGQVWVIYSSSTITLTAQNVSGAFTLTATAPYTGVLKVAYLGQAGQTVAIAQRASIYDVYGPNSTYITGGNIDNSTTTVDNGSLVYTWNKNGTNPLLHFAAIHHIDAGINATPVNLVLNTIRGDMKAYVGDSWTCSYNLLTKSTNYSVIDPSKTSDIDLAVINQEYYRPNSGIDTYFGFKELAKLADYTQLASFRGLTTQKNRFLSLLKDRTFDWLNGTNSSPSIVNGGTGYTGNSTGYTTGVINYGVYVGATATSTMGTGHTVTVNYNINLTAGGNLVEIFVTNVNNANHNETFAIPGGTGGIIKIERNPMKYDTSYGSLNSTLAMAQQGALFGAGDMNDHLFHYGYFYNALATVKELDSTSYTPALQDKGDLWLRDTLNPSNADTYFPQWRSHDWYWGHQWAAGLSTAGDGNNQESTSENANGLYWAYRYFSATGRTQMANLCRIAYAQAITAFTRYWQIPNNDVYPAPYSDSKLVGIVWLGSALNQTFFGANEEYVKGIQMIPSYPDFKSMYPNTAYNTALFNKINTDIFNRTAVQRTFQTTAGSGYVGNDGGYVAGDTYQVANNVTTTAVTGSGSGLVLNMNINQTQGGIIWETFIVTPGSGYQEGDIIRLNISGGLTGGGSNTYRMSVSIKADKGWEFLLRNVQTIIDPNASYAATLATTEGGFDNGTSKALQLAYIAQYTTPTSTFLSNFTFGVSQELETFPTDVNLVAGPWVLSPWSATTNGTFLQRFSQPANANKVPYMYLYIAAGKMRADAGIEDDNVPGPVNLRRSVAGANYIRNNGAAIANEYTIAANQIASIYGTTKPIALHFEPDFYQYNASTQNGGPISAADMATAMNSWINNVKAVLPNAKIVIDVSPWNSDLTGWHAPIQNVDFGGLVGKAFPPDGDGSVPNGIDGKTYAQISQQVGKPLILDDAHGPGGVYLPFDYEWGNATKRNARIADGVRAVLLPPTDNTTLNAYALGTIPPVVINQPIVTTSGINQTGITFNWGAIANATAYEVQVTLATDTTFSSPVVSNLNATGTSFTATGLLANTSYIYRVRAKDSVPNYSSYSTGNFSTLANTSQPATSSNSNIFFFF